MILLVQIMLIGGESKANLKSSDMVKIERVDKRRLLGVGNYQTIGKQGKTHCSSYFHFFFF